MKLDDILARIGEFGPYQLWVYHWYCMLTFSVAFHHLGQVFLGGASDHWCALPDTVTTNCSNVVDDVDYDCKFQTSNVNIPVDDPNTSVNEHNCRQYVSYYNVTKDTPLMECSDGYQFDHSQYVSTIQEDFGLVCSNKASAAFAQSVYFTGLLVGSIIFGSLADRIGRKTTLIICALLQSSVGVVTAFVQSFAAYVFLRFIIATATIGIYMIVFVMATELVGLKWRNVAGNVMPIYWAGGVMVLALFGYLIRDWRKLQIAFSVPTGIAVLYMPFLPESARWLLSQGKINKAEAIIQRAAQVNKVTIPQHIFDDNDEDFKKCSIEKFSSKKSTPEAKDDVRCHLDVSFSGDFEEVLHRGRTRAHDDVDNGDDELFLKRTKISESGRFELIEEADSDCAHTPSLLPTPINLLMMNGQRRTWKPVHAPSQDTGIREGARNTRTRVISSNNMAHDAWEGRDQRKYTAIDLFRTPNLRKKTLNLMYNWFVVVMVFYALSLGTSELGIDPYVAFMLSGLVEIPARILSIFAIDRFGRRPSLCFVILFGGACCLLTVFIDPGVYRVAVAMAGKFAMTAAFGIVYVYSAELFPTPVRSSGMGMASMSGRLGSIISPLSIVISEIWQPLPLVLFSSLSFTAGLLSLLLPETRGTHLPETIEEGESFGKKPEKNIGKVQELKNVRDATEEQMVVV